MKGKYFPLKHAIKTVHIHTHACTNAHTHTQHGESKTVKTVRREKPRMNRAFLIMTLNIFAARSAKEGENYL